MNAFGSYLQERNLADKSWAGDTCSSKFISRPIKAWLQWVSQRKERGLSLSRPRGVQEMHNVAELFSTIRYSVREHTFLGPIRKEEE